MKAEDIRPSHLRPYDPQYDPLVACLLYTSPSPRD